MELTNLNWRPIEEISEEHETFALIYDANYNEQIFRLGIYNPASDSWLHPQLSHMRNINGETKPVFPTIDISPTHFVPVEDLKMPEPMLPEECERCYGGMLSSDESPLVYSRTFKGYVCKDCLIEYPDEEYPPKPDEQPPMTEKVYQITLTVIPNNETTAEQLQLDIEQKLSSDNLVSVLAMSSADIGEWHDEHKLNGGSLLNQLEYLKELSFEHHPVQ